MVLLKREGLYSYSHFLKDMNTINQRNDKNYKIIFVCFRATSGDCFGGTYEMPGMESR